MLNSPSDAPAEEKRTTSTLGLSFFKPKEARRRWIIEIRLGKNWSASKPPELFAGCHSTSAAHLQTPANIWSNVEATGDKLFSAWRQRDAAHSKGWPLPTALVSLSLAVALFAWMLPDLVGPSAMKNSASSNSVHQGQMLYRQTCAGCHGVDLKGATDETAKQSVLSALAGPLPPPLDESGHSWMHTDAELFRIVKYGIADCGSTEPISVMPGFGGEIDEGAVEDVIAFVKSQWSDKIQRFQNVLNEGEAVTRPSRGGMICSRLCLSVHRAPAAPGKQAR